MSPVVEAYWKTFHWSLQYFQNSKPTNWDWVYPYADAPLVSSIVKEKENTNIDTSPLSFNVTTQLQFIMPKSSLRTAKRRVLYVDETYTETRNPFMKRHDWEMDPHVSLPWNPTHSLTSISHF
jgi:5'-3' exonuclease